jgi:hypothetical protein
MTTKKTQVDDDAIDPEAAEKAFAELQPALAAISSEALASMGLDRKKAAVFALKVARDAAAPGLHTRLAALPKHEFDHAQVGRLRTAALGLWAGSVAAESAQATTSAVKVPVAIFNDATAVKGRMLKVVQHLLDDDPKEGPEIDAIIPGSGYQDLADDLVRLAAMYKRQHAVVSTDPKYYLATDQRSARTLAQSIMKSIGEDPTVAATTAAGLEARAFTYLLGIYDDVAATLRWLSRGDPDAAAKYPSIFTVARPARGARTSKTSEPPPPPAGAPEAPGTPEPATTAFKASK